MSEAQDSRIGELLRQGEPPARDPFFRIGLVERREQQRYRRRQWWVLCGAVALLAVSVLVYVLALDLSVLARG